MSWCSEWIRDWLRNGRSQNELAKLGGVNPANVSRWLSGRSRPDREAMSRLISRMDRSEASELLVAWMRDFIPDGAERLIRLETVAGELEEANLLKEEEGRYHTAVQRLFPAGMSDELQEKMLFFAQLAVENPDVRKIMDVCYQAAQRARGNIGK